MDVGGRDHRVIVDLDFITLIMATMVFILITGMAFFIPIGSLYYMIIIRR
jgi:hypothetical protein